MQCCVLSVGWRGHAVHIGNEIRSVRRQSHYPAGPMMHYRQSSEYKCSHFVCVSVCFQRCWIYLNSLHFCYEDVALWPLISNCLKQLSSFRNPAIVLHMFLKICGYGTQDLKKLFNFDLFVFFLDSIARIQNCRIQTLNLNLELNHKSKCQSFNWPVSKHDHKHLFRKVRYIGRY